MRKPLTVAMLLLLALSTTSCAIFGRKVVYLKESEQVFFLNRGDTVPRDDMVCMDKGTALGLFQTEADGILDNE
jgi:hypothetical protein